MRVSKSVWNAAVESRPQLITQFRMYYGGSNKESAQELLRYGHNHNFICGRSLLKGKTLVEWCSSNSSSPAPKWAGVTAAHFILANGFAGNERVLKSALAHLFTVFPNMLDFETAVGDILRHLDVEWLSEFIIESIESEETRLKKS